jgi:hypothetical protein
MLWHKVCGECICNYTDMYEAVPAVHWSNTNEIIHIVVYLQLASWLKMDALCESVLLRISQFCVFEKLRANNSAQH